MALDQLIATHDATHREFARAIARGDEKGASAASRDLLDIGERLSTSAQTAVSNVNAELGRVAAIKPELRARMRELEAQAAALGRLSRDEVDNGIRTADLQNSATVSRAAVTTSQAMFIIFLTAALAFITGYHRTVLSFGILLLLALYKPFSSTFRWQSLLPAA